MSENKIRHAGVMGWPIAHSLSPRLHSYWLAKYKISGDYLPLAVTPDDLEKNLKDLHRLGFRGVNLTVPHKEAALPFMNHIELLAQRIGAVNTVLIHADGTLEGRNTDAFGFTQNILSAGYKVFDRPALLLGAGGAARAAIVALQDLGLKDIRIMNRTLPRALSLAQSFGSGCTAYRWGDPKAFKECGFLANATSLGLKGQPDLVLDLALLPKDALVTDMVYAPLKTALLQAAEARGNPIVDGLGMLLHQARPAFEAFFGCEAEVTDELRRYVLESAS